MKTSNRLILLIALGAILFSGCTDVRKEPYLIFSGDNTRMEVHWQLHSTQACTFEWGQDTSYSLGSTVTAENSSDPGQHLHQYTITGLTPGGKYHYRMSVKAREYTGTFTTAPTAEAAGLKFMAYGDTRSFPDTHNFVAGAMLSTYSLDPAFQSFILAVGDLVSNGDSEWAWDWEFFRPTHTNIRELMANVPVVSCVGNHEASGALYTKYFPYPFEADRYWSFDYGPALFVMVDQYVDYHDGSDQILWLQNELSQSTKEWKFIFLHEPGWSAGGGHSNDVTVQEAIQPLCETYGIDILFAGHNHYYARAVVNGVHHVTTGGGGAPLRTPDAGYPNIVTTSESHHFCKIEIIDDHTLLFAAETPDGTTIDSFTIVK